MKAIESIIKGNKFRSILFFPRTLTHDKGMNGTKNITDIWDGHFMSSNLKYTLNPKKITCRYMLFLLTFKPIDNMKLAQAYPVCDTEPGMI